MSEIVKNKHKKRWPLWILIFPAIDFVLIIRYFIQGKNIALFQPQGYIAQQQHNLMIFVVAVMLLVAVPALVILYFTAWKYREENTKAEYNPNLKRSKYFVAGLWAIPISILLVLSSVMWTATHRLAPRQSIASANKTMTIQVVALRWKWLFIYPDQKIATLNFVQLPVDTPVKFELTADKTPMSSFWIPNLGGQLYAMTGHINALNLMPTSIGDYPGSTPEINGAGFTGMKFVARVSSAADFSKWVQGVQQSSSVLDAQAYNDLVQPSENNPVMLYSSYENNLYDKVVMKYMAPGEGHSH